MGNTSNNSGKSSSSGKELATVDNELKRVAKEINDTVESTINAVAASKIKVGEALLEARALIGDDTKFGDWRQNETVVKSKQHAHYLMQVAKKFKDVPKLVASVNYSTLQELVLADEVAIKWVQEKVAEGKPPTIKETRAKVKETQAERLTPKGTSKKANVQQPSKIISPNASLNEIVQMSLTRRINEVNGRMITGPEGAFIVLGMDPDPQTPCHPHSLLAIGDYWKERAETEIELDMVEQAIEVVEEEFKAWDAT